MSDSRIVPAAATQTAAPSGQAGAGTPAAASPGATPAAGAPPAEGALSPKIQALMKREADAQRRINEAKTYEQSVKAKDEALAAREAKINAFEDLWKKDPLKALEERGVDPVQLAMARAGGGQMTPEVRFSLLTQEIASLRDMLTKQREGGEQEKKIQAEQAAAEEESQWKGEASKFVETNKDKLPLLNAYNRVDLVLGAIEEHFEKTLKETGVGEELPIEKASEQIEALLLAEVKRGQELLQKREAGSAEKPATPPPGADRRMVPESPRWVEKPVKTLAGIQSSVSSKPQHFLSDQERVERAAARLRDLIHGAAKG